MSGDNSMKKVFIFCANGLGELVLDSIDDSKIKVLGFLDNDQQKWGGMWQGIEVFSPEFIREAEYDYIVIAYSEYADSITEQLMKLGCNRKKIVVFQEDRSDLKWYESRIALMRKCFSIIRERNIPGNLAEVGVYKGDFAKLLNRYMPERKLYLFDTFEGFPEHDLIDDGWDQDKRELFKDTSEELVLNRMPYKESCIILKGMFPDTAEGINDRFCFVSLDTDLYLPIKAGLEFFYPRMEKGGYIFVHDFGTWDYNGVKKAIYEFCDKYDVPFFPLLDRAESVVLMK